uniref:Uncharacterized protein n=1 Tax=Oryza rufipogon TaxID=4529 RepID=A0A0E0PU31_ORYRU
MELLIANPYGIICPTDWRLFLFYGSLKLDVVSFGVILSELLSGKIAPRRRLSPTISPMLWPFSGWRGIHGSGLPWKRCSSLSAVYNLTTVDWDPQNYSASTSMVLGG